MSTTDGYICSSELVFYERIGNIEGGPARGTAIQQALTDAGAPDELIDIVQVYSGESDRGRHRTLYVHVPPLRAASRRIVREKFAQWWHRIRKYQHSYLSFIPAFRSREDVLHSGETAWKCAWSEWGMCHGKTFADTMIAMSQV
jgi:hypothetical protein